MEVMWFSTEYLLCIVKLMRRSLKCPCLEFSWGPSVFCPEHGVDCQELAWCPASETNFPCWSEINYSWSLHEALKMSAAVKGRWEERKWVYGLCWLMNFLCTSTDRIRYWQNNSAWPYNIWVFLQLWTFWPCRPLENTVNSLKTH